MMSVFLLHDKYSDFLYSFIKFSPLSLTGISNNVFKRILKK